jgi:hypothetical protein
MPGHDIDGEDSTEERCPVEPVSFVFLRLALSFGEHVEDAALVCLTCGMALRRRCQGSDLRLRHDPFPQLCPGREYPVKAGEIREGGRNEWYKFANELLSGPDEGFASVAQGTFEFIGKGSARQPGQSGAGNGASGAVGTESEKPARVARGHSRGCVERKPLLTRREGPVCR